MTSTHPAAEAALREVGDSFTVTATLEHGGAVGVLLEDPQGRSLTVVVEQHQGKWVTPGVLVGSHRLPASRRPTEPTGEERPVFLWSRKETTGGVTGETWYSMAGLAATDAATVTLESAVDRVTVPVAADGLVFALLRVREDEKPDGVVHTRDGRAIPIPS